MKVETTALSIKHIAEMYCVNGKHFADLYRNKISGYDEWRMHELSNGFYFNAVNIGPYMSLEWNDIQRHRANILFKHYPILRQAYELAMELRFIFNKKTKRTTAMRLMNKWYEKVSALGNPNFRSVIKTFKNHASTILNYFLRRATNASAEAFNSKVKIFRSQMRGVRDSDFFIFRLVKLFA